MESGELGSTDGRFEMTTQVINATFTRSSSDTPSILSAPAPTHTVRRWGDPVMVELMGYDTNQVGGNFQVVALATHDAMEAVQQFQVLDHTAMTLLQSLQIAEGFYTFAQKMNWLCSAGEGRPYWTEGGEWATNDWTRFLFGTLVFGGQKIAVELNNGVPVEYVFDSKYKTDTSRHLIPFYKLQGLRRDDIPLVNSGVISNKTHPHLIQKATAANAGQGGNAYTDTPRGTIYHPVWSPMDWTNNNGDDLYIAKAFVI